MLAGEVRLINWYPPEAKICVSALSKRSIFHFSCRARRDPVRRIRKSTAPHPVKTHEVSACLRWSTTKPRCLPDDPERRSRDQRLHVGLRAFALGLAPWLRGHERAKLGELGAKLIGLRFSAYCSNSAINTVACRAHLRSK